MGPIESFSMRLAAMTLSFLHNNMILNRYLALRGKKRGRYSGIQEFNIMRLIRPSCTPHCLFGVVFCFNTRSYYPIMCELTCKN